MAEVTGKIGGYYDALKAIQLTLGEQGDIPGFNEFLESLACAPSQPIKYDRIAATLDALEGIKPKILERARTET